MNDYNKQAEDFLQKASANITITLAKNQQFPLWAKDGQDYGLMYNITIHRTNKKDYSFNFWDSIAAREKHFEPNDYDILTCLTKHDPKTFNDFCLEFGYNEDSKLSEQIFFGVDKDWHAVNKMFGDMLDELREIQ